MTDILRTARVVVVEDDDAEASPLILALARLGIGVWYFNGDIESLPAAPLEGVRVVFLDLRLGSTGPSAQGKHAFSQTLAVLESIVGASKWSIGIVYWTKHEDEILEFSDQLAKTLPKFKPSFVRRISGKQELLNAVQSASNHLSSITGRLNEVLPDQSGPHLVLEWEQAVHDAASTTTNLLTEVAYEEGDVDQKGLLTLLAALSAATGVDATSDEKTMITGLFEALNPIHFDQLEQCSRKARATDDHSVALKAAVKCKPRLVAEVPARLNRILFVARTGPDDPPFQPGAAFVAQSEMGNKCPHFQCGLKMKDLAPDMLQFTADPEYRKFAEQAAAAKLSGKKAELEDCAERRAKAITDECRKLLVEISPTCDAAQAKRTTARFIGGLLVPIQHEKLINKRAQFLRWLKPIVIPGLEGSWITVLNGRCIFGVTEPDSKMESHPAFRIRLPVLVDIQAWVAAQIARPGYLSV